MYGQVTYVINQIYKDKFMVAPFDTGAFSKAYGFPTPFGTMDDSLHLILPQIQVVKYNLSAVMQRWYANPRPAAVKNKCKI